MAYPYNPWANYPFFTDQPAPIGQATPQRFYRFQQAGNVRGVFDIFFGRGSYDTRPRYMTRLSAMGTEIVLSRIESSGSTVHECIFRSTQSGWRIQDGAFQDRRIVQSPPAGRVWFFCPYSGGGRANPQGPKVVQQVTVDRNSGAHHRTHNFNVRASKALSFSPEPFPYERSSLTLCT
jgi:hypothetical protein